MIVHCEIPGSQITASGLMIPFPGVSGSAPGQPHQSSHKKFGLAEIQLNAQMIAQNELLKPPIPLPYLGDTLN